LDGPFSLQSFQQIPSFPSSFLLPKPGTYLPLLLYPLCSIRKDL
jgi:hypothetical protein